MKSARLFSLFSLLLFTLSSYAQEVPPEGEKNSEPPSLKLNSVEEVDPEFHPFLKESLPSSPRPDLRRSGVFSEVTFAWLFPNLSGHRIAPREAVLINPGRFPNIDAAGSHLGLSFRASIGYRFPSNLGEVKLTARTLYASRQLLFKNYDPHGLAILKYRKKFIDPNSQEEEEEKNPLIGPSLLYFGGIDNSMPTILDGIADPIGAMLVTSQFEWHNFDLIYGSLPIQVGSRLDFQLEAGGRMGLFFADDVGEGWYFKQRISNSYEGYGPIGAINLIYSLDPGIEETSWKRSVYFRGEGGILFGQTRQTLSEQLDSPDGIFYHQQRQSKSQTVETIGAELGFVWRTDDSSRSQFTAGYQFDQFWNLNRLNNSRMNLTLHGIFLRWERRF